MTNGNVTMTRMSGYASKKADVPTVEHYAVIDFSTIHIPGDQRSIDAPGHGYPAHDEPMISYHWFLTKELWEKAVSVEAGKVFGTREFVALHVKPAKINTQIVVSIE